MTKRIEDLVKDIYSLFDNTLEHTPSEENLNKLAEGIKKHVKKALAEAKKEDGRVLRMSSIGKKPRQLWYEAQQGKGLGVGPKVKKFSPSKLFSFLYGNLVEELVLFLAREAGHEVTEEQKEVLLEEVKGSIDCLIDGVLVDVKSASFRGFEKFKNGTLLDGQDDFGYVDQISGYAQALDHKQAAFLGFNKETGELALLKLNELDLKDVVPQIKSLKIALAKATPPEKCYPNVPEGTSGNLGLHKGCQYCPFKFECWKDSNNGRGVQVYKYASKHVFLTKVVKEPMVDNVTREFVLNEFS